MGVEAIEECGGSRCGNADFLSEDNLWGDTVSDQGTGGNNNDA